MKSMPHDEKGPWTALLRLYMKDIGPLSERCVQMAEDLGPLSSNLGPRTVDSSQPVVEQVHRPMFQRTRTMDL